MSPWLLAIPMPVMMIVILFGPSAALSADGRALMVCTMILVMTLVFGFGAVVTAIKEHGR